LAQKMKEFVKLSNSLDDLDREAWVEIVSRVEEETEKTLIAAVNEDAETGVKVWEEIFPAVQIIRLGLASDTLSRNERCRLILAVISLISGLLSPVELAGVCFTSAFKYLHSAQRRMMPMIVPFPFGAMPVEKKKDEIGIIV